MIQNCIRKLQNSNFTGYLTNGFPWNSFVFDSSADINHFVTPEIRETADQFSLFQTKTV